MFRGEQTVAPLPHGILFSNEKEKLLISATTCMNYIGIIPNERNQSLKVTYKISLDLKRKKFNFERENIGVHQGFEMGLGCDYNLIA